MKSWPTSISPEPKTPESNTRRGCMPTHVRAAPNVKKSAILRMKSATPREPQMMHAVGAVNERSRIGRSVSIAMMSITTASVLLFQSRGTFVKT